MWLAFLRNNGDYIGALSLNSFYLVLSVWPLINNKYFLNFNNFRSLLFDSKLDCNTYFSYELVCSCVCYPYKVSIFLYAKIEIQLLIWWKWNTVISRVGSGSGGILSGRVGSGLNLVGSGRIRVWKKVSGRMRVRKVQPAQDSNGNV